MKIIAYIVRIVKWYVLLSYTVLYGFKYKITLFT